MTQIRNIAIHCLTARTHSEKCILGDFVIEGTHTNLGGTPYNTPRLGGVRTNVACYGTEQLEVKSSTRENKAIEKCSTRGAA